MQMLKLKQNLNPDVILPVVFILGLAVLWYFFWVQPRDEFLHAVMDCMGEDMSEAVYQECAGIVANSAR